MSELNDLDLRTSPDPAVPPQTPPLWPGVVVIVLIVGALGGYWFLRSRSSPAPAPAAATSKPSLSEESPAARAPLGAPAASIDVPPLDQSDPLVRQLVAELSSHPLIARWLVTDGLIRHFAAGVQNVVAGQTPAQHAHAVAPAGSFEVRPVGARTVISARSFDRYNPLVDAISSIDPRRAAQLYGTLKPRIEEAYAELGEQGQSFDAAIERAIVLLLETPVPDGDIAVVRKGLGYAFADPRLEQLAPAQKQLLRMGPANAHRIQAALQRLAIALGIPAERLPAA
jgi:hypothetical protein